MPRPSQVTQDTGAKIVSLYDSGESIRDIVKKTGIPRTSVRRWVEANCSKVRTCRESCHRMAVNDGAFSVINDDACYWAGFLMADGCVSQGKHSQSIILVLKEKDVEHIELFRQFIGAENPIGYVNSHGSLQRRLSVTSDAICDDLAVYGVVPRKTYTAKAADFVANNKHFWRGMVDGDGSIMIGSRPDRGTHEFKLSLCGTRDIIDQFVAFTRTIYPHKANAVRGKGKGWQMCISGVAAQAVIKHLYSGCTYFLRRKMIMAKLVLAHHCGQKKCSEDH